MALAFCGLLSHVSASDDVEPPPVVQGKVAGVALDSAGNRYIVGTFDAMVDFNPGDGADARIPAGGAGDTDVFVTRFDRDGTYRWTQTFGGAQFEDAGDIVVTDTRVYVCGSFASTSAHVGGAGATVMTRGMFDGFVMALDAADGSPDTAFSGEGVQTIGGSGNDYAFSLVLNGSTLYFCGKYFSVSAVGIGGTGIVSNSDTGGTSSEGYVAALDTFSGAAATTFSGDGIQTFVGSGNGNEIATGVAFANSLLYVCGEFSSTNFGVGSPGTGINATVIDSFIVALDAAGAKATSFSGDGIQVFTGNGNDQALGIAATTGLIYVTGKFNSNNAGIGAVGTGATSGLFDCFVISLTNDGSGNSAFSGDGILNIGSSTNVEFGTRVTIASGSSTIYVCGNYDGTNGGFNGSGTTTSAGGTDAFVAAMGSDGMPAAAFGNFGIQTFGGSGNDLGTAVSAKASLVFLAGAFVSTNAGFGATGSIDSTNFGGYLAVLNAANGGQEDNFEPNNIFSLTNPPAPGPIAELYANDDDLFSVQLFAGGQVSVNLQHNPAVNGATIELLDPTGTVVANGVVGDPMTTTLDYGPTVAGIHNVRIKIIGNPKKYSLDVQVKAFVVTAPNGGETILGGSMFEVNWQTLGSFSAVDILLYTDSGATLVGALASATIVDGREVVTIPAGLNSSTCRVVVKDAGGGNVQDISDADFTITSAVAPTLTVTSPNGGENLAPGTIINVKWTSTGMLDKVNIAFSADNGGTFAQLAGDLVNDGNEDVMLPAGTNSAQCLIKVEDHVDGTPSDVSDAVFRVGPLTPPVINSLTVSQNPAKTNVALTFTANVTDPLGGAVAVVWEFGDGAPQSGNPLVHTYTAGGTYTVKATAGTAAGTATATISVVVEAPNSGSEGSTNISTDDPPIGNPLDGLSVSVTSSEGGVVELSVNVDALFREMFEVETEFTDIPGRGGMCAGPKPVHKFVQSGIWIAKSSAKDSLTKEVKGKVRKTLPISRRETGEPARVTSAPPSQKIAKPSMKGKFRYSGDKPDEVTFSGAFQMPEGMDLTQGQPWSVSIGNIVDDVMIDKKGKPMSNGDAQRIKKMKVTYPKPKKGTTLSTSGQMAKLTLTLSVAGMPEAGFDTEGIDKKLAPGEEGKKSVPRQIQVAFVMAGVPYEGMVDVLYALSKSGEDGAMTGRGSK